MSRPTLRTERLILRPMTDADALDIQRLAGDRKIAATTLLIPHPYPDGAAEEWIATHEDAWSNKDSIVFAIANRSTHEFMGAIGLVLAMDHLRADLGYWIGVPYWGQGLITEAARELLRFGFKDLGLNRIEAHHFHTNPASGRVMQKIDMQPEGTQHQKIKKWDEYVDTIHYAILRSEFDAD